MSKGPDRASLHAALQEGLHIVFSAISDLEDQPRAITIHITMLRVIDDERRKWEIEGNVVWCEWAKEVSGHSFTGDYEITQCRMGFLRFDL